MRWRAHALRGVFYHDIIYGAPHHHIVAAYDTPRGVRAGTGRTLYYDHISHCICIYIDIVYIYLYFQYKFYL